MYLRTYIGREPAPPLAAFVAQQNGEPSAHVLGPGLSPDNWKGFPLYNQKTAILDLSGIVTKHGLFSAMGAHAHVLVKDKNGYNAGYLSSIQREDESGSSFNVLAQSEANGGLVIVYVRTVD